MLSMAGTPAIAVCRLTRGIAGPPAFCCMM
jgi:hypothetical protein